MDKNVSNQQFVVKNTWAEFKVKGSFLMGSVWGVGILFLSFCYYVVRCYKYAGITLEGFIH
jgi:hypothetical protein